MIAFLNSLFCTTSNPKPNRQSPKIAFSWSGKVSVSADEVIRSPKFRKQMEEADAFFNAIEASKSK